MDGIEMASVDRFWDIWKLVDVRYRSDNGEQRFVYANDVAWKTMQAKGTHYPDGAMFGKLAFHTANDPAFPSSFEPRGFSRLQIMKKDAKAYPDSDGWGYAVITSAEEKDTGLPAEDLQIAAACHACHRLVPERDFVFSRGPFTDQGEVSVQGLLKERFVARTVRELTAPQQRLLEVLAHTGISDPVRYLAMPLFTGSVNEVAPVLAKYANEDHSVYLVSDTETGNFALADGTTPLPEAGAECAPGTRVAWTASPSGNRGLAPEGVKSARLCGDRLVFSLYRKLSDVLAPPSDPWQRRVDVPGSARPPTPPK
jgi:hypothetical protein